MSLVASRENSFIAMEQGNIKHMNDLTNQLNKLRDIVQDKFWRMAYGDYYVHMDFYELVRFPHVQDHEDQYVANHRSLCHKHFQTSSKAGEEVYAYFENLGCDLARHVLWVGTETHVVIQLSAGWRLKIPVEVAEKILVLGLP